MRLVTVWKSQTVMAVGVPAHRGGWGTQHHSEATTQPPKPCHGWANAARELTDRRVLVSGSASQFYKGHFNLRHRQLTKVALFNFLLVHWYANLNRV